MRDTSNATRAFLLAHDTDPFNKWEAGRALGKSVLTAMLTENAAPEAAYLDALSRVAIDDTLDPGFRARVLQLPGEDDMAQSQHIFAMIQKLLDLKDYAAPGLNG